MVHGAEMQVAETRAVNRTLRKAGGIGISRSKRSKLFSGRAFLVVVRSEFLKANGKTAASFTGERRYFVSNPRNPDISLSFPQIAQGTIFVIGCTLVSAGLMKNLHTVLRQKEQDAERVRQEIRALLMVIPLLADDQPSANDVMHQLPLTSSQMVAEPSDKDMADLEVYFPWVRRMR